MPKYRKLIENLVARISTICDGISGRINPSVYLWGQRPSILAFITSWSFYFLRLISPLQIIKFVTRFSNSNKKKRGKPISSEKKQRPDFEAADTEIYFVSTALILAFLYFGSTEVLSSKLVSIFPIMSAEYSASLEFFGKSYTIVRPFLSLVLFIEGIVWASYYLMWRNFSERDYTLYHPSEYFVLFPIILLSQCFALGILLDYSATKIFYNLVDANDDIAAVNALGKYYFIIIISNLLSMYPTTKFKPTPVVNIVGHGDVVRNRILPAFFENLPLLTKSHIEIFTIESPEQSQNLSMVGDGIKVYSYDAEDIDASEKKIISRLIAARAPTIIATPSDSHFAFAAALNASNIKFAVEKPLSNLRQDIKVFTEASEAFKKNIFALSYYTLEKALPLIFFLTNNYHFEKYLEIRDCDKELELHKDVPLVKSKLGAIKKVAIRLLETSTKSPSFGQREWTETDGADGLLFETMIHPLMILGHILKSNHMNISCFKASAIAGYSGQSLNSDSATFLNLFGKISTEKTNCQISLACGKYSPKQARDGFILYENGKIEFDFESKSCTFTLEGKKIFQIKVKPEFRTNYKVQLDLSMKFFNNGWLDLRYDDFDMQIDVLNWIISQCPTFDETFKYNATDTTSKIDEFVSDKWC